MGGELEDLINPKLSRADFGKEMEKLYGILKELHGILEDHETRIAALERKTGKFLKESAGEDVC